MKIDYSEGGLIDNKPIQFTVGFLTIISMDTLKFINGITKATKLQNENSNQSELQKIIIPKESSNTPLTQNDNFQEEINKIFENSINDLTKHKSTKQI